ncbi:MAG: hypothetical protein QGG53_46115 [Planctomycetota bacterium]|jgi:hypothetical protein|nr:hypothetical protein [Planctomycetota bacterium]
MKTTVLHRALLVAFVAGTAFKSADCEDTTAPKESEVAKPAVLFLFWNTGHLSHRHTKRYLAVLEQRGFTVSMVRHQDIAWDLISKYNTLVFASVPNWNDKEQKPTEEWKKSVLLLRRYLDEGGGILMTDWPGPFRYSSLMHFLGPYGFTRLTDSVHNAEGIAATQIKLRYATTTSVIESPVTKGITRIWYPVYHDPAHVWNPTTDAFAVDKSWSVVLHGGPSSYSKPHSYGFESVDRHMRKKGVAENVPLYAIRELPSGGRLAFCAINAPYTFMGGLAPGHEMIVLEKGLLDQPSHMGKLLLNTYHWLSAPSLRSEKLGGGTHKASQFAERRFLELPPLSGNAFRFATPRKGFHGVVGPRTNYSTGKSTVAEYGKVARREGWDFIVFLEDFNHLDYEAFSKEQEECARLSDDKLLLAPGIAYQDEDEAWRYVFSAKVKLPAEWMLVPGTRKFKLSRIPGRDKRSGFQVAFLHHSNPIANSTTGFFRTGQCDTPFWAHIDYDSVPVFTSEDGRNAEELVTEYTELVGNGEWPNPIAISVMDSADQLAAVREKDLGHTVLLASDLSTLGERLGAGTTVTPESYATEGPVIEAWQQAGAHHYDYIGNLWDYTRYRSRLQFKVSSDAGLKEVRILDGDKTRFRFLPNGAKSFARVLELTKQQQQYFSLIVTDLKGRRAVGGTYHTRNHNFQQVWCGDRRNTLGVFEFQKSWSAVPVSHPPVCDDGRPFFPFFDGTHNIHRPGGTGKVTMYPTVRFDRIPGVKTPFQSPIAFEGSSYAARRSLRTMASVDIVINDFLYERTYPSEIVPLRESVQRRSAPNKVMRARVRVSRPYDAGYLGPPANQAVVFHVKGEIELLRDVSLWDGGYPIAVGNYVAGKDTSVLAVCRNGEEVPPVFCSAPKRPFSNRRSGPLPVGAYVWTGYPLTHGPALALFPLSGGPFGYRYGGGKLQHLEVFLDVPAGKHRRGERFAYEYLTLSTPWDRPPTPEYVERFRDVMGLDGTPGYRIQVQSGKAVSSVYVLALDGEGKGFAGTLAPPRGEFPAFLPVQVRNLNSRWSAIHYDMAARRYRPIGSVEGVAYTHVQFDGKAQRLFVGHPFTCDQPEAVIALAQTGPKKFLLTVHNPTDKLMKCTIEKSRFFTLTSQSPALLEVPAGDQVVLRIGE